ncbi:MAG: ABC transporter substrate-binding protein [Cohaesibacter sp.]|nr:ABC transporter substrate-binding protein [Cohaesibacter sp.]
MQKTKSGSSTLWLLSLLMLICVLTNRPASAQTKLHIHSATDTTAIQNLIARFEELNRDIDVIYHEYNTNHLFDTLMRAPRSPDAKIDLVISSAMDLQVKLVNEGLASPYQSDATSSVPGWASWRDELYGFTYEPLVLAYNRQAFENNALKLPSSHSDLADLLGSNTETFSGKVGTYDINRAGSGYLFITQDAIQSDQVFRLMEALSRSQTRTYCCSSDILDLVTEGKLILGYNLIGSYALEKQKQDERLGVSLFQDYTIVLARTAFIYKFAPNQAAAERFLEFLLSRQGQSEIASNSALIPIAPELRQSSLPENWTSAYLPIKLGIGLLAYQDGMKRKHFLDIWNNALRLQNKYTTP